MWRIRPDVVRLSMPILAEQVLVHLVGVVTAVMATRLGTDATSAIGMVDSISAVVVSVLAALAIGATVVVAQWTGRGVPHAAAAAMNQALVSGTGVALVIAMAIIVAHRPLLGVLFPGSAPEVVNMIEAYLPYGRFVLSPGGAHAHCLWRPAWWPGRAGRHCRSIY